MPNRFSEQARAPTPGHEPAAGAQPGLTVATKLLIPPPPLQLVVRERLFEVLEGAGQARVTSICAPAGMGKTALLSSWSEARRQSAALCWLSIGAEDNDPARLAAGLLRSLRVSGCLRADGILGRLELSRDIDPERLLTLLINGLGELGAEVVLVLDDVHQLTDPAAVSMLGFLVRYAPAQLRLVLAGRTDAGLPIERLRVSGQLAELRAAELAFTRAEVSALFADTLPELSDAQLDLLWSRTEGWPAGLRLAALSLRGHPERGRFIDELAGTDRAIAAYLRSEVLSGQPAERYDFMLRTCVVDELDGDLAGALTAAADATAMLAELERTGAFVFAIESRPGWYRCHRLLTELLRAELAHLPKQDVLALHRRAARWYVAHARGEQAIRHALAGDDWRQAGELIVTHWLQLALAGDCAAVSRLMARLPIAVVEADPELAVAVAGSCLCNAELVAVDGLLVGARNARDEVPEPDRHRFELTLAAVELHWARLRGDPRGAERRARRLTRLVGASGGPAGAQSTALRCYALFELGSTQLWGGSRHEDVPVSLERALGNLERALALATEGGHDYLTLECLSQLAIVRLLADELQRAEELAAEALKLAQARGWSAAPAAACAYLVSAAASYRRGETKDAERQLTCAARAARTVEAPVGIAIGLQQALLMAATDPPAARRAALKLRAIRATCEQLDVPRFLALAVDCCEARILLAAGDTDRARRLLARARDREPGCAELLVIEAAAELGDGAFMDAGVALAQVLDRGGIRPAVLIEAWLLQALVHHANGTERAASSALERSLALAETESFRNMFLQGGTPVRELLERHAQAGTEHPALLEVLLGDLQTDVELDGKLPEPLTECEQRILRYLPTMLSNAEIGAELFVSLNTVKTHLRGIYRKLGVNGRADAVEQARRLGLLPCGIKRPAVLARAARTPGAAGPAGALTRRKRAAR
ncbi:MAG TPA: LuxR C-terminal-related transcriptional regulator [Solirubrobacteraceae bacterium]|nr:LuxR C-terminal-related transcriptional regulator [Solirubrobacteraceae bacterium]